MDIGGALNHTQNTRAHSRPLTPFLSLLPIASLFPTIRLPLPLSSTPFTLSASSSTFFPASLSLLPASSHIDPIPAYLYTFAAGICLLSSAIWHTFSGCADWKFTEAAARGDYVGIGWLISSTLSTVMYYAFRCQPVPLYFYMGLCLVNGILGSILPFQEWFNQRKHKNWRILFYLSLGFSSLIPLGQLAIQRGFMETFQFVRPAIYSASHYLIAVVFYASHFPECVFPGWFDWCGSHAIWHVLIIVSIRLHWKALEILAMNANAFSCSI